MPPERVRRFAELGRRQGWDLFVMYGATEATARMAYLPPQLAASHPAAIGRPIPGGAFTIEPCDAWGDDVGELVYRGPNVMMGYAHGPADLPLGKTVEALHTGDIVRRNPDGLYEVIGRSSRFVKMYGLRIDLQRVEADGVLHRRRRTSGGCGDGLRRPRCNASRCGVRLRNPALKPSPSRSCRCCRRESRISRRCATAHAPRPTSTVWSPARAAPTCCRRREHRSRGQLCRPWRQFAVLRDDVGAAGTRAGATALRLAATSPSGARSHAQVAATVAAVVGCDAGEQRRTARDRDLFHRRVARRDVRTLGRRARAAGHRGIQLRPVLPHSGAATGPGAAPAQHHRVDRGTVGGVGCDRPDHHRRLHADKSVAGQQVPRPARQHDRR